LQVLDPALVVTLGRFSMTTFMPGARISSAHGTLKPVDPAMGASDAMAYAMYHPAAAFRQNALKETLRADMAEIPAALIRARELRNERRGAPADSATPAPVLVEVASNGAAMTANGVQSGATAETATPDRPGTDQPEAVPITVWVPDDDLWAGFDVGPEEPR
ncbi:MAG: hypothetical protein H0W07_03720, partial [Chloroflexi bacterium]|nr:hypothetical protein [Chloroflexota bacterium]